MIGDIIANRHPLGKWAERKTHQNNPGQIEISFSYSRHTGPTYVGGGLTLQFDSLRPFSFTSQVTWPGTDNYEDTIRQAVEDVSRECQGHLNSTSVILRHVEWDDIASSREAFRRTAIAATRAAFGV